MLATRTSFDRLIARLCDVDFTMAPQDELADILATLAIDEADLAEYVNFHAQRYTRSLIFRNASFELLVLCWSLHAVSSIHDHGGQQCYLKVLRGRLDVEDFALRSGGRREGYAHIAPAGSASLRAGATDVRSATRDLHRVSARHEPAISLHVYASPVDRFMIFNPARRACRTVFGRYDFVAARCAR